MKLGFIGTGKISSSVITGICGSSIKYSKIYVSSRNNKIAKGLKKKFKRISIEKDNQKIVDNCNWIFLAVTPTVGEKIIKDLKFRSSQTIVSFISTITIPELKKMIKSMGEKCKVSIRNIRRDANDELKKLLKSKEIGEDEEKTFEKNVQNITDKHIQIVDEKVSSKEKEIMTI